MSISNNDGWHLFTSLACSMLTTACCQTTFLSQMSPLYAHLPPPLQLANDIPLNALENSSCFRSLITTPSSPMLVPRASSSGICACELSNSRFCWSADKGMYTMPRLPTNKYELVEWAEEVAAVEEEVAVEEEQHPL